MSVDQRVSADSGCRRTLDQLVALVRVWTPTDGVVYVNRAWRDLTGTTLEDNLGEGWLSAVHPDDRAGVLVAFSSNGASPADYRVTTRDGQTVTVRDAPSPWSNDGGGEVTEVVHTITVKDAAATHSAQTMSKWAHELRGPLNAILGWSDLLGSGENDVDVTKRGLNAIANNARQQALIIKRMSE